MPTCSKLIKMKRISSLELYSTLFFVIVTKLLMNIPSIECQNVPGGGGANGGGQTTQQTVSSPDCESCPFDFTGALTSLYVMLVVLLAVLTPMLVVLILVVFVRCCCRRKYVHNNRNSNRRSTDLDICHHQGLIMEENKYPSAITVSTVSSSDRWKNEYHTPIIVPVR
ncbi:uncharacterized protein LOC141855987 [Brevipalpus obovatus]|uniref:uncharacterized protein LOC141855987 n=1 Tax=Brevipalpus obovatus TaxID=246614 RepID=UPI003D9E2FD3